MCYTHSWPQHFPLKWGEEDEGKQITIKTRENHKKSHVMPQGTTVFEEFYLIDFLGHVSNFLPISLTYNLSQVSQGIWSTTQQFSVIYPLSFAWTYLFRDMFIGMNVA